MTNTIPKTILIVIDGFGYREETDGNAILSAKTPNLDKLWSTYPHTLLKAAEEEVGLQFGQVGNSEVGHMAIGAGRVVLSPFEKINQSISEGQFQQNKALLGAIEHASKNQSKLHIIGMISNAGVHADTMHFIEVIKLAKQNNINKIYLHPITDGRDTGRKDSPKYLEIITKAQEELGVGIIASIAGRSYAMDRNRNWQQTQKYYDVLVGNTQSTAPDAQQAIHDNYSQSLDDETLIPTLIDPTGVIEPNDAVIITNFREDRARQIAHALADKKFDGFQRKNHPNNLKVATMTEYDAHLDVMVAFPMEKLDNTLSSILEKQGLKQLHIAETEKYFHVTHFFNGGRAEPLPNEELIQIKSDSPDKFLKNPEMQANKITTKVLESLENNTHHFIIINFANPDMIGHTGNFEKTIQAVEAVDTCIGQIAEKILEQNGYLFIAADHGNAEITKDLITGKDTKDHTISPVPFIMARKGLELEKKETKRVTLGAEITGILQDIPPTILEHIGLPVPDVMTGINLFQEG